MPTALKQEIKAAASVGEQWTLGSAFNEVYEHHGSMKALWEKKWRFPCEKSVYPFHDGKLEDFEEVFQTLISKDINDAYTDAYTETFFPKCEQLTEQADEALKSKDRATASSLYLRVAALYRISRFPIINSAVKRQAYEAQKSAYLKATSHWIDRLTEQNIPHTTATEEEGKEIPVYVRVPVTASAAKPVPCVLLITGLDGYRPDNTQRTAEFASRGWATVIVEIPGTADCPADPKDPNSPDRLWDSVFQWMRQQKIFDMKNVTAWGLSCGGYYAVRVAHTHKDKLRGVVAQGAGLHKWFDPSWLATVDGHEYPFDLTPALAQKYGYSSVDDFVNNSQKDFSLLESGIVERPSSRLFLVNGTHDGLMPVEDSMLLMSYGSPKEARFFPNLMHMGYPISNASIYPWLEEVMRR